jgi:CMP-N-acetylneuraminic acid synthetase
VQVGLEGGVMKIIALVPIKLNNERTPGKNTKCFSDGTPLMYFVQEKLLQVNDIDKIYLYCSSDDVKPFVLDGIEYLKRPKHLDSPTTTFNEIFDCFYKTVDADIYVTAFATAPFISLSRYVECVRAVKSGQYDSAFTAVKVQDFLWDESGQAINFNPKHVPRTQDLPPLYSESGGLYVLTKEAWQKLGRKMGENPYKIFISNIEATDIDYPDDFELADVIYQHIIKITPPPRVESSCTGAVNG